MNKILIAGANAIDLVGVPKDKLIEGDSNIGTVTLAYGGVSRNVAEILSLLGEQLSFLSPFGEDHFSMIAQSDLTRKGIALLKIKKQKQAHSVYLSIHNQDATLCAAINDFSLAESVTPHDLEAYGKDYPDYSALVLDTNFTEEAIGYLVNQFRGKPIFVDGVSQTKVERIHKYLSDITLLKVNQRELESLSSLQPFDQRIAMEGLLKEGLKELVVSNGKHPITFTQDGNILQLPIETPRKVVSSNGAGDALFSGIIHQYRQGKDLLQAVTFGLKLARLTMEVSSAINPDISQYASDAERSTRL